MTSVKKIKVALLALVAALVIAIPTSAFAGTINITTEDELATDTAEYNAYQVFGGTYEKVGSDEFLKDVRWGDNVDAEADGFYAAISEALGETVATPQEAVKALKDENAEAFAAAINKYITGTGEALTQSGKTWTVSGLADGFWLVRTDKPGKTTDGRDGAYTEYVTKLVGPETVLNKEAKASIPQVEKGVIEDSDVTGDADAFAKALDNYRQSADYDIDQGIPYYIAGTLPTEYDRFETYYYEFNDVMSDGLDLVQDSVHVYVYTNGVQVGEEVTSDFTITKGAHSLNVKIDNLKDVVPAYVENTQIVVLYNAKLNANCVIGSPGNPNGVELIYSREPNQGGEGQPTGKTPKKYAIVYTYGQDYTKIDQDDATKTLAGAEFVLINKTTGKQAVVTLDNGATAKGTFASWADKGTTLITQEDGIIFVKGLDADEYILREVKQPAGYNTPAKPDTEYSISASLPDGTTVQAGGMDGTAITVVNDSDADGDVEGTIANGKGATLPGTGGIGTTIFTVVGILLMAVAAFMVIRRRSAADQQ